MARQLVLLLGCVAAQTVVCGGDAQSGGDCADVDFTGTTDIIAHGHGFIALDRNYGKAKCTGLGAAACDGIDWKFAVPGVDIITSPKCATVVMWDKAAGVAKCSDLNDTAYDCDAVDFRGVDTVMLGGGALGGACSGVAWSK
jgi:hypothetical protein